MDEMHWNANRTGWTTPTHYFPLHLDCRMDVLSSSVAWNIMHFKQVFTFRLPANEKHGEGCYDDVMKSSSCHPAISSVSPTSKFHWCHRFPDQTNFQVIRQLSHLRRGPIPLQLLKTCGVFGMCWIWTDGCVVSMSLFRNQWVSILLFPTYFDKPSSSFAGQTAANPNQVQGVPSLLQPLTRTLYLLRCSDQGDKPTSLWTTNHQWHVLACDPCGSFGGSFGMTWNDGENICVTHSSILPSSLLSRNSTRTWYILTII